MPCRAVALLAQQEAISLVDYVREGELASWQSSGSTVSAGVLWDLT